MPVELGAQISFKQFVKTHLLTEPCSTLPRLSWSLPQRFQLSSKFVLRRYHQNSFPPEDYLVFPTFFCQCRSSHLLLQVSVMKLLPYVRDSTGNDVNNFFFFFLQSIQV